jgi:hypothetical protein
MVTGTFGPVEGPAAAIVRAYTWTRGRTRPTVELELETLVSAVEPAAAGRQEHRAIAELCGTPHSVAEVAALLGLPLGVAKVLIGDMAQAGVLAVHGVPGGDGVDAQLALMERVLGGLRRL